MTDGHEPAIALDAGVASGGRPATVAAPVTFDAFFAEQYPRLVRVALLIVGSTATAEEVVQDAFIRVLRAWDDLDNPAGFARVCVVNGCRDRLRRRARWRVRVPLLADDASGEPSEGALARAVDDDDSEILELVQALPERQRAAIVLRYYDDLTPTEVAEVLGISVAATKSLLHRALEHCREELDR